MKPLSGRLSDAEHRDGVLLRGLGDPGGRRRQILVATCRSMGAVVFLLGVISLFGDLLTFEPLLSLVRKFQPLRPNASVLLISFGLALVLSGSQSPRPHRLPIALALFGTIWAALAVVHNAVTLPLDFDSLFLNRWSLSRDMPSLRVREYPAATAMFIGLAIMLVNVRPGQVQDAVMHAVLCFFGSILAVMSLPYFLDRSLTQIFVYIHDVSAQAIFAALLLALACASLWFVQRMPLEATLQFRMRGRGLAWTSLILVLVSLGSFATYLAWVSKLEHRQRDHLEQVFRLQAAAVAAALDYAEELSEVFGSLPMLREDLDRHNRGQATSQALRSINDTALALVRKSIVRVVVHGLDGNQILAVGGAAGSPTFDYPLDYDRRLLWSDGSILRRTVVIASNGRRVGHVVADIKLHEFDRILSQATLWGPNAETIVCAPNAMAWVSCLPSRLSKEPFLLERSDSLTGRALTYAIDGKFGTMLSVDSRNVEMFSAYGGLPPYSLGLVSQIALTDVYAPVRGSFAWYALFALTSAMMLSVSLRRFTRGRGCAT